ncbi:MAG: hypothetical protein C5B51_20365 [Terriglobia bacterium]|nr:MAG: hypothetical protein C5B51_20365 [Terriglobia bacterium]
MARECSDPDVRVELESLLRFADRPLGTVARVIGEAAGSLATPDLIGQRIGVYRLTNRIGHGGMGAVYRGERADDQFQQTVAIKLLRFPDGDPAAAQRFRSEREILASLDHPNVARLLDGGAWIPPGGAESQPYIVMEYIEGLPLTRYCDEKALDLHQRLRLFRLVCGAVSYAHRQLIVHRDIKPANILVTPDGTPKLLDFGVAKLLDAEIGANAFATTGLRAMTPDYASPEQVRGEAVSTLTDVYGLGAVLYELLTGKRAHQLNTYDPLEIAREICEREVAPPRINADVDMIVLKALQKDATRRYASAEQLSEDVRRYLAGLPIIARPDTLHYRAGKFVRRHRLGMAAIGAVFVALVVGGAASLWEARRADGEAATARAVSDFLQNDLLSQAGASAQSGPGTRPDPDLKVRTALDRAAARVESKFRNRPLVEASIRQTIGSAYKDLGLLPAASQQVERALALRRMALGDEAPDTLRSLNELAELDWTQGKRTEAGSLWIKLLETRRKVLGPEHPETLTAMTNVATMLAFEGKTADAEALNEKALAIQRRILGSEHVDTLTTINNLGLEYLNDAKYAAAEPLLSEAAEIERRVLGEEHPNTLSTGNNLALLYSNQGKHEKAEALFAQLLELRRRVLGERHPKTLLAMNNLASAKRRRGKYEDAEALYQRVVELRRHVMGEYHPDTLITMNYLGVVYRAQAKYGQAEAIHKKVVEAQTRLRGEAHPETLFALSLLGQAYESAGRYGEAEALFAGLVEAQRRVLGARHIDTTRGLSSLGSVRLRQGKYVEAEQPLREALRNYETLNSDTWERFHCQALLGASLAGQQKYSTAEPLLGAGYEGLQRRQLAIPAESREALSRDRQLVAWFYQTWERPEKAAAWLR